MGQATSSPTPAAPSPSLSPAQPAPESHRRRSIPWRRSLLSPPIVVDSQDGDGGDGQHQQQQPSQLRQRLPRPRRPRSASFNRLSQFLNVHSEQPSSPPPLSPLVDASVHGHDDSNDGQNSPSLESETFSPSLRPSRLQRARTSINASLTSLSHISFRRSTAGLPSPRNTASTPALGTTTGNADGLDFSLPDVSQAALDLNFDDHDLTTTVSTGRPATPRSPSRRSSLRLPNGISDRFSGFRSDRTPRTFPRRRRSPNPAAVGTGSTREGVGSAAGEDNTALLSRLLSVAAAATAATLLEGNQQAIADARSVAGDGDDGTFNSFLQSLESGRLAAALRGAGHNADESGGASPHAPHTPLNFFRMFRFGTPAGTGRVGTNASTSAQDSTTDGTASASTESNTDGRMVPIIIVGIRAVNPSSASGDGADDSGMPPFLDALSALPTTPFGESAVDHDSIDHILRSPRNGTHFTHRRRASMGGVNGIASGYDAQRHHRSPERAFRRPVSVASDNTASPRPPPATPASNASLSRLASTNSAVAPASRPASLRSTSRRESIIRTTTTTTLESTSEDAPLRPRAPRQRRLSESDYRTTFSSRRNGIVEPDHPSPPSENTRSWIIYVLGGSYPENHPILTTPSLFTDSPTYEDMMLLSALLGPAKPPVASEQDVARAGGIFKIERTTAPGADNGILLVAVGVGQSERIELVDEQRCLVCLCDFEAEDEARQLVKCKHLFHKECIDEWLTKGRNSCPLCRGQGVDEKEKVPVTPASVTQSSPASPAATSSASLVDPVSTAP